jgi:hypothetical protein
MIQPATAKQRGTKNATYFNRGATQLVLMLKFALAVLQVHIDH